MDFKNIIAEALHKETGLEKGKILSVLEVPPDNKLGDYAFPCFMLSKELKKSPQNIALELQEKLTQINLKEDHKHFEHITNQGPYLNFFINKNLFTRNTLKKIFEEQQSYGAAEAKDETILIESPGPNTNKPLHLGHLRNILLGQTLYNILKKQGYKVHIVNVVNDRGIHICKSMLAYQKFSNNDTPESTGIKSDHFVGNYYVKYKQLETTDESAEKEAQAMLVKWENNDPETIKLWKTMNAWALEGFSETYKKLGFKIDKEYLESETYKHGREQVLAGLKNGIFQKDETGAVIFDLENKGLGKKVLLRSDNTSVYITQDIYMAYLRHKDFNFSQMYYVVGNEQEHHFKVLFEVFKALGWKFADKCYHFSYGMVELPEGKMKSREGKVVDTDDLIKEVSEVACEELKKRYPDLSAKEFEQRANIIAMSAIRFFFLKFDPLKNFVFNPTDSMSFDGETGPYIEYSNARINSIFKKLGFDAKNYSHDADITKLVENNEYELVTLLAQYPKLIEKSANELKPSIISRYLLELTQKFNEFYHNNQVLNADEELKKARIYLIYCIQQVLISAMNILGITPVDEM